MSAGSLRGAGVDSDGAVSAGGDDTANLENVVQQAAQAARDLRAVTPAERAAWLVAIADALTGAMDELVAIAYEETHLAPERLRGEVTRTINQIRLFTDVLAEGSFLEVTLDAADPTAAPPLPDLRRFLIGIGPVAVFAASNFPFAFSVAGGDTVSALAAGCPVIVKAHPSHPRLSRATAAVVEGAIRNLAPPGTFALVAGQRTGVDLVLHPEVQAVAFTGSTAGGRALHDLAVNRPAPIPFYGELGSLNPVVITSAALDAGAERLAAGLAASATLGAGQFCTKPGLVLTTDAERLVPLVAHAMEQVAPALMLDRRIRGGFSDALTGVEQAPGVEVAFRGTDDADGLSVAPVLLTSSAEALLSNGESALQEIFGPATLVVQCRDDDEVLRLLTSLPGMLTATVHADADVDRQLLPRLLAALERCAGRVVMGGWPTGVAVGWATHHGGPYPATTASLHTSVGASAVRRFLRPVAYQDVPDELLPPALQDANPLGLPRRVDGRRERE